MTQKRKGGKNVLYLAWAPAKVVLEEEIDWQVAPDIKKAKNSIHCAEKQPLDSSDARYQCQICFYRARHTSKGEDHETFTSLGVLFRLSIFRSYGFNA